MLKWILIGLLMLLVVGATAFGLYLLLQPEMVTAKAMFLAESTPASYNLDGDSPELSDWQIEIHRKTLEKLCLSQTVLTAAMENPDLQGTFLTEVDEPFEWLKDNVVAEFEGKSELLTIELEGPIEVQDDLKTIVEAVSEAFLSEIVSEDRLDKFKELESFKQHHGKFTDELRTKLTELNSVRSELGRAADGDPEVRIRELEIESMERFQAKFGDKITWMELDLQKRPQVTLVEPAHISDEDEEDEDDEDE